MYARSAEEHYRQHQVLAEAIERFEPWMDNDRRRLVGAATMSLTTLIVEGWKSNLDVKEYENTEGQLTTLLPHHARFYLAYAEGLAKTKFAYRHMRHIWHAEAIADAHAADVELNL